ncbi:MDJ2 [Candida metapsilosis]|uniref:MDJ2 n=1 Tax=Candida metapsilosis TaxID=273372 RepID=A0A8H7ZCF7_9ASCO|nr:MDJ2 [Candida metapsilosis]
MTEQEALLILGIEGDDILNVDKKMVRDRYRKLMVLNHPDKQGSQYLSQKINEAKDVLDKSYMIVEPLHNESYLK